MAVPTRQERSQVRLNPVRHISLTYGNTRYSIYFQQVARRNHVVWRACFGSIFDMRGHK